MKPLFLQYPQCTTCKKALKYLKEKDMALEVRHIVQVCPTEEELATWIKKSGLPIKKFFNTSGVVYKEMQLKDKLGDMNEEEMIKLLASNGKLIKRPLLITDNNVCVGFKEAEYEKVQ